MEKINFDSFKKYVTELENSNISMDIQMMIRTNFEISNVCINIENYLLTFYDKENKRVQIDINYVANFFINKEKKN